MRQKYQIIQDAATNKLKIREYAIIDKNLKNTETSVLQDSDYCLLYEEIYDGSEITNFMSRGTGALISALRTIAFSPIAPNAVKIAESVISLYASKKGDSVDLFFDDAA